MNTTFGAKEAVKLMLDGLQIENIADGSIYQFTDEFLIKKTSNFGQSLIKLLDFISGKYEQKTNNTFSCEYKLRDKKLREWYRPVRVFIRDSEFIHEYLEAPFKKSKQAWFDDKTFDVEKLKILKWESEYFPETWNQCE